VRGRGATPAQKGPRQNGVTDTLLHLSCCGREKGQLSSRACVARAAAAPGRQMPAGAKPTGANMAITVWPNRRMANGIPGPLRTGPEDQPRSRDMSGSKSGSCVTSAGMRRSNQPISTCRPGVASSAGSQAYAMPRPMV
jgi:hypothetical protein